MSGSNTSNIENDSNETSDNTAGFSAASASSSSGFVSVESSSFTARNARNSAEKQRRDKLNTSLKTLATLVPHVIDASKRQDKNTVLRLTTHGLRLRHVFGTSKTPQLALESAQTLNMLLGGLGSSLITLTIHGYIILVSENVEKIIGYSNLDFYGQNVLYLVHPEDHIEILNQLVPRNLKDLYGLVGTLSEEQRKQLEIIDKALLKDTRRFTVRMVHGVTCNKVDRKYIYVHFDGSFRRSYNFGKIKDNNSGEIGAGTSAIAVHYQQLQAITDAAKHGISGNDIVFVGMIRIVEPTMYNNSTLNKHTLQYITRHLIDGRIVECEQRIALVAGYMVDEVRNLSPFSFMHQDDCKWVVLALRQMYESQYREGESYYRLLTRTNNFIYLHTRGYVEVDPSRQIMDSLVCINTLLSDEEGQRRVKEMKTKYSIIIKQDIPQSSAEDATAAHHPLELQSIVMGLVSKIYPTNKGVTESTPHKSQMIPTYNLMSPSEDEVKSTISRSVNVILQQFNPRGTKTKSRDALALGGRTNTSPNSTSPGDFSSLQLTTPDGTPSQCSSLSDHKISRPQRSNLVLFSDTKLKYAEESDFACTCGRDKARMEVILDSPTGMSLEKKIFLAEEPQLDHLELQEQQQNTSLVQQQHQPTLSPLQKSSPILLQTLQLSSPQKQQPPSLFHQQNHSQLQQYQQQYTTYPRIQIQMSPPQHQYQKQQQQPVLSTSQQYQQYLSSSPNANLSPVRQRHVSPALKRHLPPEQELTPFRRDDLHQQYEQQQQSSPLRRRLELQQQQYQQSTQHQQPQQQ